MIQGALLLALFGLRLARDLFLPFSLNDGSWNLLVAARVAEGQVPYRDFAYGATPLALWLSGGAVALLGKEVWVLRAAIELCFVLGAACSLQILRLLDVAPSRQVALIALLLLVPPDYGPYTTLATACLLATAYFAVALHVRGATPRRLALGGVAAALAILAKQNVGAFAAVALAIAIVAQPRSAGARARDLLVAAGAGALPLLGVTLFLAATGALGPFVDYAFLHKRSYLAVASMSVFDTLAQSLATSFGAAWPLRLFRALHLFCLAPLALLWLLLAFDREDRARRRLWIVLLSFFVAGQLAIYPRGDLDHIVYGLPSAAMTLFAASALWPAPRRSAVFGAGVAWIAAALVVNFSLLKESSAREEPGWLPTLAGARFRPGWQLAESVESINLRLAAPSGRLFVLAPSAANVYLTTGLQNPTPFDYPFVTTLGTGGEAGLIAQVERRELNPLCLGLDENDGLAPRALIQVVTERMYPLRTTMHCKLYDAFPPSKKRAIQISVTVRADRSEESQLFWDDGTGFQARNSVPLLVRAKPKTYTKRLLLDDFRGLRFDPCTGDDCAVEIVAFNLTDEVTRRSFDLKTRDSWDAADVTLAMREDRLDARAAGADPRLVLGEGKLAAVRNVMQSSAQPR